MGETIPYLKDYTVYTLREPHGVTGHIIPWNYPMQIIGRSVGAALAMWNAIVLKPAEEACLTALAFAEIAREAGIPKGAINVVPGFGEEAGASLSSHAGINHISFTGSVKVARDWGTSKGGFNVLRSHEKYTMPFSTLCWFSIGQKSFAVMP